MNTKLTGLAKAGLVVSLAFGLVAPIAFFKKSTPQKDLTKRLTPESTSVQKNYLFEGMVVFSGSPDGDSVHFRPDRLADMDKLLTPQEAAQAAITRAVSAAVRRIFAAGRVTKDGSVQLRIEGIDAPELHYQHLDQPMAVWSRDVFIKEVGNPKIKYDSDNVVTFADPASVRAFIISKGRDRYGRPISYIFLGRPSAALLQALDKNGGYLLDSEVPVRESVNYKVLQLGASYVTLYSTTPASHRQAFVEAATEAFNQKLGIWAEDKTSEFILAGQNSIGPKGALVLPKLFRRLSTYLSVRQKDESAARMTFPEWLRSTSADPKRDQDDLVYVNGSETAVRFSSLLTQEGNVLKLKGSVISMIFGQG